MKLRLSNGYSFAVEFAAANQIEFTRELRAAAFAYFYRAGRNRCAELQVATDSGEFLSAHYPRSNSPFYLRFGQTDSANWRDVQHTNQRGTWFEHELDGLTWWANQ